MKAPRSQRRSRAEWEQLMAGYEAGDVTQREFCAQQGLAYSSFCYWRKQLRTATRDEAASLVELAALPSSERLAWRIELDLGQGIVLRVR